MTAILTPVRPRSRAAVVGGTLWRMLLIILVGIVAFPIAYGEALQGVEPDGPGSGFLLARMLLDIVLGLVAWALFPFRHRAPLPIVVALVAISAVSTLAAAAAILGIVSISTRRRWREIAVVAVAFTGSTFVVETFFPLPDPVPLWQIGVFTAVLVGVLVVTGMYIGGRRQLRLTLLEQAAGERREQASHLEQARASERARLAREMHDVLAHRLSLVALHAGALEFRADLSPEQKRSTAGVVRENAHLALSELREVLGVLREATGPEAAHATRPQPTLAGLAELLDDSHTAGTPAVLETDATVAAELDSLAPSLSRHLHRIIQEGLTNARKHAPGSCVLVQIGGEAGDRVTLSLSNALPGPHLRPAAGQSVAGHPSSGLGLAGLAERVRLAGGELSAGIHGDRFILQAWVPWKN